jgi:hypothetical protein
VVSGGQAKIQHVALNVPGIDYAWGTKPYDTFKAQGFKFAMRYLSHDAGKDLSAAERDALWKRGIKVGLVWESTAGRALQGFDAGLADAEFAKQRCNALGLKDIPVYFAVDFDATEAQKPVIAKYLLGAVKALGHTRVGVYGGYYVVKYMHDHAVCRWFWQTYAWSGGHVHAHAHVYQHKNGVSVGGLSCDLNKASKAGLESMRGPGGPDPRLKKWRRELRIIRAAAKVIGWLPGLKRAANKRKRLIKENS